jgi:SnoaL-like domain
MRETIAVRERDGILVGGGAALTLIVILVLQSFIGSGLLSTRTETSTITGTQTVQSPVNQVVDQWFYYLGERDVTNLANLYSQNATLMWEGEAGPLSGTYHSRNHVAILFNSTIGRETNVTATIANYSLTVINPTATNATFSLTMNGTSPDAGQFLFKVNVNQEWTRSADAGEIGQEQWQIAEETWNFTICNSMYPIGYCY